MSRFNLRQRPRISYYEPDEPNLDEYIFCDKCGDIVYEYCSVHGPLLVIPDDKAGIGVFSTLTLPSGVRFGPYRGERTKISSMYSWQIYDRNNKPAHLVDAMDATRSNWMRYVNCARHWTEQNLVAYQYQGQLYYRTIKIIPKFTELMVFYGSEFANCLGIDLRLYDAPPKYAQKTGVPEPKKRRLESVTQKQAEKKPSEKTENKGNTEIEIASCDSDCTPKIKQVRKPTVKSKKFITPSGNNVPKNCEKSVETFINGPYKTQTKALTSEKKGKYNTETTEKVTSKKDIKLARNLKRTDPENLICDICKKSFAQKWTLIQHIASHDARRNTNKDPYHRCVHCKYKAVTLSLLENHLRFHDENRKFCCQICNYRFKSRLILHSHNLIHQTHTREKPFVCVICKHGFTRNGSLKQHLITHTREKPFVCVICKHGFTRNGSLKRHMITHTREKPFVCVICKHGFTQNGNLKQHLITHTREKPFVCVICKHGFTENGSLKQHLITHTREKPFVCKICKHSFGQKIQLTRHTTQHTGEKP